MQKHFLNYLTEVMSHQWNDAALTDYGENHEYTFSELATEMLRMHTLFEKLGLKKGSKFLLRTLILKSLPTCLSTPTRRCSS